MSWQRDAFWPAFAESGMLVAASAVIDGTEYPDVRIGFVEPDELFIDGNSQHTRYEIEFQTDDLPGLTVGNAVVINGFDYTVKTMPELERTGFFSRCELTRVTRSYPKQPIAMADGLSTSPGSDGSTVFYVRKIAAAPVVKHRVVHAVNSTQAEHADNSVEDHGDSLLGIANSAAAAGAFFNVQTSGPLTDASWAWTPEEPIWVGADGALTQSPPDDDPGVAFSARVAFALTSTQIFIGLEEPVYL